MKKILSNKYIRYSFLVLAGICLGWLFFHSPQKNKEKAEVRQVANETVWTCAMHPQIRMHAPGKCPICGMDLIPVNQGNVSMDSTAVHLTKEAAELANVLTTVVSKSKPVKEIRLYGKVQADERLQQSQVSHVSGRIEKLLVNYTGEFIRKGQPLAVIYSPELVTAQQELLEAAKMKGTQPEIYQASRERLLQWKLTDSQIADIEKSGKLKTDIEIESNSSGIITAKKVSSGDYISQGMVLFDVADLSDVWVLFDAYESDIYFLKKGQKINFTVQALPGSNFSAAIAFIEPVIDPVTRVAKVRVEMNNGSGQLKPEMFVTGTVEANLDQYIDKLVIPRSAVLWTGKRSVVYVKQPGTDGPVFKMREIELGPMLGDSYVVGDGLSEGEEIVTQGAFSVDAAAQLQGKPSMMNAAGGIVSSMQLNAVFDAYIVLKNACVESDAKKVSLAAESVRQALDKVDKNLLTGSSMKLWMEIQPDLVKQIGLMESSGDIEQQRLAFSSFSAGFYRAVKSFGLMDKTVYYQFCPMAFNNKGAYWLSEINAIRNPYFGDKMLTCGQNKETLKY